MTKDARVMLGDPRKALLVMAVPMLVSLAISQVNTFVDTFWCSNLGSEALAAVGIVSSLYFLLTGIGNGLGMGISVAMARRIGAGEKQVAEDIAAQGIDVMFLTCADQAGVDQPNEHMDRTLLMISYLIQGDMDRAYAYLSWHDGIISKVSAATATLADSDKQTFLMARTSPNDKTSDISITGKNNINNIHAETAGADSIGQRDPGLTSMYQTVSVEYIIGLDASYYVDNTHAGFRYGGNETAVNRLHTYMQQDHDRYNGTAYSPHILGMAREAGNGPMYVIEVVFYQDVLYPNLDNGLDDYGTLFHYYLKHFTSVENPDSVDVAAFFQAYS